MKPKVTFQFAVVYTDEQGQVINLFKTQKQAEEYYEAIEYESLGRVLKAKFVLN